MLVSSTSVGDKDQNETVIDLGNGAIENAEGNVEVEVSSRHSDTQESKKQPSNANSRSSRRRQIEKMELENLRAIKETEQRLQGRHVELEQEREEIELRRQQEELRLQQQQQQREQELQQQQREQELRLQPQQQEQELRLKMQQQGDELRLRQHERALANERRKAAAEEEQRCLKFELTKRSPRASGSVTDELEIVVSRRNQERTAGWAESFAQQSVPRRPLSPKVAIEPPMKVTQDRVDKHFSTYPKTTPLFQPGEGIFSTQLREPSILKKPEIRKSIRITDPPAPSTRTTFHQQGTSAVQERNRSQSTINNSQNRSVESRNRSTKNQISP